MANTSNRLAIALQILGTIVWCVAISPAILVIAEQKTIHPKLVEAFTASDVFYLLGEIFTTPGLYFAWLLSGIGMDLANNDWFAGLASCLLFLPCVIWPFLKPERHRLLKKMLCGVTILFVVLCVALSLKLYIG